MASVGCVRLLMPFRFLLALLCIATSLRSAEPRKPNVVILLADDLRPDGLGALGHPVVKTPNLDPLVSSGFIFRRCYTMGSMIGAVCRPSRTMLLTGQSMFRADNKPSGPTRDEFTFPRAMKEAGYATLHSGKNDNSPKLVTAEFDETYDPGNATAVADKAVKFIGEHAGKQPLFLYIAGHEPHDPQYAPPEFYAQYKPEDVVIPKDFAPYQPFDNGEMIVRDEKTLPWPRTKEMLAKKLARYYASTAYWDSEMGRILDALRKAGEFENTLFVIGGDNGLSLGEHGLLGKQNLYEFGGMHVPCVFSGKGIPKGETRAVAYWMDLFPTVCELVGITKPARVEGLSLAPVIHKEKPRVREFMYNVYRNCERSISDDRWKLIRYPLINKTQLFDLSVDPHEEHDLGADPAKAPKISELMTQLARLQQQYADTYPLTVPNPAPSDWSPTVLTSEDIKDQEEETAVTFGKPPQKKAKKAAQAPKK